MNRHQRRREKARTSVWIKGDESTTVCLGVTGKKRRGPREHIRTRTYQEELPMRTVRVEMMLAALDRLRSGGVYNMVPR